MNRAEVIEYYEKEIAKIEQYMPFRSIAEVWVLNKKIDPNDRLSTIMTEYGLLVVEIEGLKQGTWDIEGKAEYYHPQTHIETLRRLLNMEEGK